MFVKSPIPPREVKVWPKMDSDLSAVCVLGDELISGLVEWLQFHRGPATIAQLTATLHRLPAFPNTPEGHKQYDPRWMVPEEVDNGLGYAWVRTVQMSDEDTRAMAIALALSLRSLNCSAGMQLALVDRCPTTP